MAVFDEYNKLFPSWASIPFNNTVTIDEEESTSKDCKVRHAVFVNVSGVKIPHGAVLKYRTMYDSAGSMELLRKNCDGAFCNRDGDMLILNMCELKTTADESAVETAKEQIVSVATKLRLLVGHLQSYDGNVKVRGFIVARKPGNTYMSTLKDPKKESTRLLVKLFKEGHLKMKKHKMEEIWCPLKMIDIDLYFYEVPANQDRCTIDYSRII